MNIDYTSRWYASFTLCRVTRVLYCLSILHLRKHPINNSWKIVSSSEMPERHCWYSFLNESFSRLIVDLETHIFIVMYSNKPDFISILKRSWMNSSHEIISKILFYLSTILIAFIVYNKNIFSFKPCTTFTHFYLNHFNWKQEACDSIIKWTTTKSETWFNTVLWLSSISS